MWNFTGQDRPAFAAEPGPGQESVWDYPRPPALRRDGRHVEIRAGEQLIASTIASYRLLETASPPTFYLPPEDVNLDALLPIAGNSVCEWKGAASYFALPEQANRPVAWTYARPRPPYDRIRGYIAFYPGRVDCCVDGEPVRPQPGRFYGGWVTDEIVGPFKGEPGTGHW